MYLLKLMKKKLYAKHCYELKDKSSNYMLMYHSKSELRKCEWFNRLNFLTFKT